MHYSKKHKRLAVLISRFRFLVQSFSTSIPSTTFYCDECFIPQKYNASGFFLYKVNIDFSKPYNYHRDNIKSNPSFLRYIENNILKKDVSNFVYTLGLTHCFLPFLKEVDFGVVLFVSGVDSYLIFRFSDKQFIDARFIVINPEENIGLNDIVVIERSNIISKSKRDFIPDRLFKEGVIVYMNKSNSEGFIRTKNESKDFYFRTEYCNFNPDVGAVVRYIPGYNFSKRHLTKPTAFIISFLREDKRLARVYNYSKIENYYDVYLIDLKSNEQIFSRVFPSQNIKNYEGVIGIDFIFDYYIPEKFENEHLMKRVYLRSLESRPEIDKQDFSQN